MSEKEDYFNYVSAVLGVRSIYMDQNAPGSTVNESTPLMVTVEGLSAYSNEEKDLLDKMISALKIDLNKIKIFDLGQSGNTDFEFLLNFADAPDESSTIENSLTTYSPRVLVKNPALKKQVWNELQKVIKYFSN